MYFDPLISPFFSTFNWFLGTLTTVPIIAALWYTNVWNTAYIPINSNRVYANTGGRYVVTRIVDEGGLFNKTAYEAYSPAYISASNIIVYGVCECWPVVFISLCLANSTLQSSRCTVLQFRMRFSTTAMRL